MGSSASTTSASPFSHAVIDEDIYVVPRLGEELERVVCQLGGACISAIRLQRCCVLVCAVLLCWIVQVFFFYVDR